MPPPARRASARRNRNLARVEPGTNVEIAGGMEADAMIATSGNGLAGRWRAGSLPAESFASTLRRFFLADDLPRGEVDRLEAAWRRMLADRARRNAIDLRFAPFERAAHGLAWWEQRQRGSTGVAQPISDLDRACMLLSVEPALRPPPAWPHCPDELVGTWVVTEVSSDNETLAPAPRRHELTLATAGVLRARRPRAGFGWRIHRGSARELWLGPATAPRTDVFTILRRDRETMDVAPPGVWRGFERWTRH
jgi:hypothetical protein